MSDDYTDFDEPITTLVARWHPRRLSFRQRFPRFRARMNYRLRQRQHAAEKRQRKRDEQQKRDKYRRQVRVCACGYVIKDDGVICGQCRYNMRERVFREALPGDVIRWERARYLKTATVIRRLCNSRNCEHIAVTNEYCEEHLPKITLTEDMKKMLDDICTKDDCEYECDRHTYDYMLVSKWVIPLLRTFRKWQQTGIVTVSIDDNTVYFRHTHYINGDRDRAFSPYLGVVYTQNTYCLRGGRAYSRRGRRFRPSATRDSNVDLCTEIVRILVAIRNGLRPYAYLTLKPVNRPEI